MKKDKSEQEQSEKHHSSEKEKTWRSAVNRSDIAVHKSDIAVNKSDIAVNTVQIPTWGGSGRFSYIYIYIYLAVLGSE